MHCSIFAQRMRTFKDQTGRTVPLSGTPARIVSLVPSLTELLCDLELHHTVVGRTKFCIHPADRVRQIPEIGGTKTPRIEQIFALMPDLIVANKEENRKEDILALASRVPVWVSDISTVDDALSMIHALGIMTERESSASSLCKAIQCAMPVHVAPLPSSAVYLIWQKPLMVAGNDTFIHAMMACAGLENVVKAPRYPTFTEEQLNELAPKFVLLSSEPFPFKEKHVEALQSLMPHSKVHLVDGEYFSWYGSRILPGMHYLKALGVQLGMSASK